MSNPNDTTVQNRPIQKVAVIGSGIAGLATAWLLSQRYEVTLLEAASYFGGHTHTVDVEVENTRFAVDTGFLVLNPHTYPNLLALFKCLDVAVVPSDMSFSVVNRAHNVQWAGTDLSTLFAQKINSVRPNFWRMIADIVRFNRYAKTEVAQQDWSLPLGTFLKKYNYSRAFIEWYLLPMTAAIWSCSTEKVLQFPAAAHIHFFRNHGLLQIANRPQWLTVKGGARQYVEKMLPDITHTQRNCAVLSITRDTNGIELNTATKKIMTDAVVFACHADQALAILREQATTAERIVLSQCTFQKNRAVLHTDESLLPEDKRLWSAWNFVSTRSDQSVSVSYLINKLQPLPVQTPIVVTLNPSVEPDRKKTIATFEYEHPVFDKQAHAAQQKLPSLQGNKNTWFCGAWTGYGFHEDGLRSAITIANALGVKAPWQT